jgi:uncharacterized membrane-anchored protein
MVAAASDHGPILLKWNQQPVAQGGMKKKNKFHYEVMWEAHEEFSTWLSEVWRGGKALTLADLQQKLSSAVGDMVQWGHSTFGHVRLEFKKLKEELEKLQRDPHHMGLSHAEVKITA